MAMHYKSVCLCMDFFDNIVPRHNVKSYILEVHTRTINRRMKLVIGHHARLCIRKCTTKYEVKDWIKYKHLLQNA